MMQEWGLDIDWLRATDGRIASINLESARRRSWSRFFQEPQRIELAAAVLENERLTAQFIGDVDSLDRVDFLARYLDKVDASSTGALLIRAQVASMLHRFADAKRYVAPAALDGAPEQEVRCLELTIDQACGVNLELLLHQRREMARESGRLDDLVPLGGLLGDLHHFAEADRVYRQAFQAYRDVSPFPVAWVCFQLGVLWGELVPEPQETRAEHWYRRAIEYLPSYAKARIHLAEIYFSAGRLEDAGTLLVPVAPSGDPEVHWRLADVMASSGKVAEAEAHRQAARDAFESLLKRHLLAFADHAAEFYAESGGNCRRALDLARINLANRPTLRAFEQTHAIALSAGDADAASELLKDAAKRWGSAAVFRSSRLAQGQILEGAVA